MAYSKKYMIEESLKAIQENKLFFIDDIFAYVEFCAATFYNHELEKVETIKRALAENSIKARQSLKQKWYMSDNPTLQIALYKLLCPEEEYHRLANTKQAIDHTSKGEKIDFIGQDARERIKELKEENKEEDNG